MKNLEPKIYRQRLIMEGHYLVKADGETIRDYLSKLSKELEMRIFSGPYSWPPDKWDHKDVKLHELNGFVAWTESGCHVYAWRFCNFFTVDVYSCKKFSKGKVLRFTKSFWKSKDMVNTAL